MSEQFDIKVKIDPGNSQAALAQLIAGLKKAEDEAKKLNDEAKKAAEELEQSMAEAAKATEMEARMLERATGRSRNHAAEVATLKKLYDQGRISGEQYIRTLEKMGVEFEHTAQKAEELRKAQAQQAMNTIGFGSAKPESIKGPSMLDGVMGGATGAAIGGALIGGAQQVEQYIQAQRNFADEYTNLTNSAVRFAEGGKDTNQVLREQAVLAASLQSTLGPTMDLYDAIGDVTGDLNLSQRELLGLTKTLGQASIAEGQSMESAGKIMADLSIAMQAGVNGGSQLQKIFRDFPPLGQALAAAWHTDTTGVIEMVSTHQKGINDIIDVWDKSIPEIQRAADAHKMTYAQEDAVFREKVVQGVGQGYSSMVAAMAAANGKNLQDFKVSWNGVGLAIRENVNSDVFGGITRTIHDQTVEWKRLADAADEVLMEKIRRGSQAALDAINGLNEGVHSLSDILISDGFFALVKAQDPWFVKPEAPKKIEMTAEALARLAMIEEARRRQVPPSTLIHEFSLGALGNPDGSGVGAVNLLNAQGYGADGEGVVGQQAQLSDFAIGGADWTDKVHQANEQMVIEAEKAAEATREAWASGLGDIGKHFISMAAEGKASWREMTEQMIQELTRLAIKMAVMKLVSGGGSGATAGQFLSGLAGGAHGFDYVANGNALQLPGFAHGGDMRVSGGGGVDSHLLMARVSPGESVHVRTPQQQEEMRTAAMRASGLGVQPRLTVNVIARNDPREVMAAMGTYDGLRATAKIDRQFARQRLG